MYIHCSCPCCFICTAQWQYAGILDSKILRNSDSILPTVLYTSLCSQSIWTLPNNSQKCKTNPTASRKCIVSQSWHLNNENSISLQARKGKTVPAAEKDQVYTQQTKNCLFRCWNELCSQEYLMSRKPVNKIFPPLYACKEVIFVY
jgi:hypothetical protein